MSSLYVSQKLDPSKNLLLFLLILFFHIYNYVKMNDNYDYRIERVIWQTFVQLSI